MIVCHRNHVYLKTIDNKSIYEIMNGLPVVQGVKLWVSEHTNKQEREREREETERSCQVKMDDVKLILIK